MRRPIRLLSLVSAVGAFAVGCASADPGDGAESAAQAIGAPNGIGHGCGPAARGDARCHVQIVLGSDGAARVTGAPAGYGPADLQSAYKLSSSGGAGMTVAVVDAFDYPNAESDLAVYRSTFGLPPCTTANGCFKKVNQAGVQGSYPRADSGWATEEALDVDMVSAICPSCKIVLVEANSASQADLGASVNTAVRLGANAVSNSYGGGESSASANDPDYDHPGVAITASSGDNGFGVEFPASSQYVTAVGGTSLTRNSSPRGWGETAWSGAGSGCSAFVPKPTWQTDTGCSNRTVADVSAVADPNTGVAVYETFRHRGGWQVYGGTSVASPIVASVFALAGANFAPSVPYAHAASLFDVTSGSNGSCGGSYLCTAGAGYDGPTGLGTPDGTAAF
jgi:subtilase family serine protease